MSPNGRFTSFSTCPTDCNIPSTIMALSHVSRAFLRRFLIPGRILLTIISVGTMSLQHFKGPYIDTLHVCSIRVIDHPGPGAIPLLQVDIITEEFLYQLSIGFSPLFVALSSTYAHRFKKSSCSITRVSFPVIARYMSSMTEKFVGKRMSKYPCCTCCTACVSEMSPERGSGFGFWGCFG